MCQTYRMRSANVKPDLLEISPAKLQITELFSRDRDYVIRLLFIYYFLQIAVAIHYSVYVLSSHLQRVWLGAAKLTTRIAFLQCTFSRQGHRSVGRKRLAVESIGTFALHNHCSPARRQFLHRSRRNLEITKKKARRIYLGEILAAFSSRPRNVR